VSAQVNIPPFSPNNSSHSPIAHFFSLSGERSGECFLAKSTFPPHFRTFPPLSRAPPPENCPPGTNRHQKPQQKRTASSETVLLDLSKLSEK
jgi:hypothetical protein